MESNYVKGEIKMKDETLLKGVVQAILDGKISLEQITKVVCETKTIPEDVIASLHTLFCTRSHAPGGCTFYNDVSLVNRTEKAEYKRWEGLARLYIEIFDSTVEGLREEIRFLREVIYGGPSKSKHTRILSLYLIAYVVNSDDQLLKFIETSIKKLNAVSNEQTEQPQ